MVILGARDAGAGRARGLSVAGPPARVSATGACKFTAPEGWVKIPVATPDSTTDPTLVAMFVKNVGKPNQRIIQIVVEDFDLGLTPFETSHESELRQKVDSTFVDKKTKLTLPNGMPAYWIRVSQGKELGQFTRRYEYVIVDLKRGITVSYIGRQGDFDEKEAQTALAGLEVVVYPNNP